jgi:hypothetical protein
MVKVLAVPTQPLLVGLTVIVASPTWAAVNEGRLPDPLAASPMEGLLFSQVKVAPVGVEAKVVAATVVPEQAVLSAMALTVTAGLTVIRMEAL